MSFINDPMMKEIIDDFCTEAEELFNQLDECIMKLENNPLDTIELEKYGQKIDRIMGAAKSIGATEIATFCELGKVIGYKSSQTREIPLLEVVVAILGDTIDMLRKMIKALKLGDDQCLNKLNTKAFVTRLQWLSAKFKDIERSSCAVDGNLKQSSIDDLLESLGL
jgi:chemotaxis protein histidine kinase CheA